MPSFLKPPLDLDPYEMASEKSHAHWVLRPGHKSTIEIFIADKEALKRTLTARILKEKIPGSNNSLVEIMRVNEDGFVGDALDTTREFPRILMLGDSVTFGVEIHLPVNIPAERLKWEKRRQEKFLQTKKYE